MKTIIKQRITRIFSILFLVYLYLLMGPAYSGNVVTEASDLYAGQVVPPDANGGQDIVTFISIKTLFTGYGSSNDSDIVKYEWDFNGDGQYDYESSESGLSSHIYKEPGNYNVLFRVTDSDGNFSIDSILVQVYKGKGKQKSFTQTVMEGSLEKQTVVALAAAQVAVGGDGIRERYAVMINGSNASRFWDDVIFMYSTFIDDYQFTPESIYLLNYNGMDAYGGNPESMIDYSAAKTNIDNVFAQLGAVMDSDDELLVWITGHGRGYNGPGTTYYGYMDGK